MSANVLVLCVLVEITDMAFETRVDISDRRTLGHQWTLADVSGHGTVGKLADMGGYWKLAVIIGH